jgi:hypothetical protein
MKKYIFNLNIQNDKSLIKTIKCDKNYRRVYPHNNEIYFLKDNEFLKIQF